jgi:hypothetical protein
MASSTFHPMRFLLWSVFIFMSVSGLFFQAVLALLVSLLFSLFQCIELLFVPDHLHSMTIQAVDGLADG